MKTHLLVLALLSASSCAVVKSHRVAEAWAPGPVKRLLVMTQPVPGQSMKAGELFSLVARRYVNQKRNFIVKENRAQSEAFEPKAACTEGLEGVLWLSPRLSPKGAGVEGTLEARLVRCQDAQLLWEAQAGGSFSSTDEKLAEVTQQYVSELGEEVADWVAPAFNLLRPTLDTLPNPSLTDEEVGEKIELGE